ncbi:MAG: hypothetical protein KKC20_20840 [Proteobacteria bacterium]|nr:hypothetical protein [Pseudomonadota bacterium]
MISKIHISPPEIVVHKETGPSITAPVFKDNQVVTAKVQGLLAQGKARLLIDGQPVIAKTGLLLKPGEELRLKVVEQKDTVLLKLLEPQQPTGTKQLVFLIRSLARNNAWPEIARSKIPDLAAILQKTALQSGKRDDAFLPRLLENNGLLLEKKMASLLKVQEQGQPVRAGLDQLLKQDLKGVLLNQLTREMTRNGGGQKTVTRFLDTLENFQLLNSQTSESGRYLIPFPVSVGSDLNFGQLLIDTGEKKQGQNQENQKIIRVSFLLDMTQMGPVRADFSILKKAITGRFLLNDDDICGYVKNRIPELKARLEKIDYSVGNIDCLTADSAQIQPNTLMESLFQNQDDSVVNIVI